MDHWPNTKPSKRDEETWKEIARLLPDTVLRFERARRNSEKRTPEQRHAGGRPQVLSKCPECGLECNATQMRVHKRTHR
jgi:hypothetical protein